MLWNTENLLVLPSENRWPVMKHIIQEGKRFLRQDKVVSPLSRSTIISMWASYSRNEINKVIKNNNCSYATKGTFYSERNCEISNFVPSTYRSNISLHSVCSFEFLRAFEIWNDFWTLKPWEKMTFKVEYAILQLNCWT